ncbi:hypothetical protein [Streptomyces sp. NPDC086787]|uniref:hypothetical protein n=1 Tax=Streptomyces sp. NPDC086787 TaxID=3365759 RepID=UPI00380C0BBE
MATHLPPTAQPSASAAAEAGSAWRGPGRPLGGGSATQAAPAEAATQPTATEPAPTAATTEPTAPAATAPAVPVTTAPVEDQPY